MNPAAQWMTIASMMMCGLSMGLVFDFYRVASHRFHVARWLLPALDVVYWAAATLGVFAILLGSNEGEVRMYVFLGLGIGVTGYFGIFSKWIVKLAGKLIDVLKAVALLLWKTFYTLILTPLIWLVRLLAKLLDVVFVITAALLLWLGKLVMKPVAALARFAWRKLLPVRRKFQPAVVWVKDIRQRLRQARDVFKKKP